MNDFNQCLLFSLKVYQWNMTNVMMLCRCYLLLVNDLKKLDLNDTSNDVLKYSDKFHNFMLSSAQLDFEVYENAREFGAIVI